MGEYAAVNGLRMYYEIHGELTGAGRPLVLLHGGLHSIGLSFGGMLPRLAESRQVIAVELQGHGRTADIDRPITLPLLADDVVALLDQLGVERADVFGFSLGGLVALQLAVAHPSRAGRLVLASAHFRADGYHDDILDPALYATSTRMPTADDFAEMAAEYGRLAPDPSAFERLQQKLGQSVPRIDGWTPDQLRGIAAPTLIMVGDNDFVKLEHAAEMASLIPDAQLAVLPRANHVDVVRRPRVVVPMVEDFLAGANTEG